MEGMHKRPRQMCGNSAPADSLCKLGVVLSDLNTTTQVDSSFRSAQIFCSCPMNYSHAIYKGKEAEELL